MEKTSANKTSGMSLKKLLVPILVLFLLLSVASSVYLFKQVQTLRQDPQKVALAEVQELLATVGQLIVLPSDETPTVATVSDPEQLKTQAFFAQASKGDKVLLYTNAKKAILYNPETNKIVEVAPINIGNGETKPEVAGATTTNTETQP
jgi:lipopolysaccharide export LptBFGC system permease protein LptF